ncbi:MAG TPA: cytochrome P460 family protein [Polyangiaceae bacterium]|nr:cytochrome P460 family protein [Polyangiaceae bacterium]
MATQGFGRSRERELGAVVAPDAKGPRVAESASPRCLSGSVWRSRVHWMLLACSAAWAAVACEDSSSPAGVSGGQSSASGGASVGGASHTGGRQSTGGSDNGGASTAVSGANTGADPGVSTGGRIVETTGGGAGGTSAGGQGGGESGAGGEGRPSIPTLQSAQALYSNWHRATEEPQNISSSIFALCRLPSMAEQAFVESEHGDNLYLLDWLNDEAYAGAAVREREPFPTGAAIVKEKLRWNGDAGFELAALGIMIKHEPGYDSEHGDWEFGYWESGLDAPQSDAETATYCGGCHATSPTDFAFLDQRWRQLGLK